MNKKFLKNLNISPDVKSDIQVYFWGILIGGIMTAGGVWSTVALCNDTCRKNEILSNEQWKMKNELNQLKKAEKKDHSAINELESNIKLLEEKDFTDCRYTELRRQILKEHKEKTK